MPGESMDTWISQTIRLANPIREIACALYPLIGFKLIIISIVVVELNLLFANVYNNINSYSSSLR